MVAALLLAALALVFFVVVLGLFHVARNASFVIRLHGSQHEREQAFLFPFICADAARRGV